MARPDKKLGEMLLEDKVITDKQLEKALLEQQTTGTLIGNTIVNLGFATEEQVLITLSRQIGFPYKSLKNT